MASNLRDAVKHDPLNFFSSMAIQKQIMEFSQFMCKFSHRKFSSTDIQPVSYRHKKVTNLPKWLRLFYKLHLG